MNSLNGGYAMIKYNSTQEELQIAYRSKKPVLFYDENQRAHWAVIEETATESVDEETEEPIIIYEYSYRLLDEESGGNNLLEDIVDKNGNKRFVEGSGTPETITGMTVDYNKWSLSGTHLMLVMAGTFENNVSATTKLNSFELPEWILNKIVAIGADGEINRNSPTYYYIGGTIYQRTAILKKTSSGVSFIQGNLVDVTSGKVVFRIQFDLLIDNE